jgi:hypothetical protein
MSHEMFGEVQVEISTGDASQSCAVYGSPSALLAGASWVKSSEPAESEPFILGFVMPPSFLDGVYAFRTEDGQSVVWQSQVGVIPEPPPPRAS